MVPGLREQVMHIEHLHLMIEPGLLQPTVALGVVPRYMLGMVAIIFIELKFPLVQAI